MGEIEALHLERGAGRASAVLVVPVDSANANANGVLVTHHLQRPFSGAGQGRTALGYQENKTYTQRDILHLRRRHGAQEETMSSYDAETHG